MSKSIKTNLKLAGVCATAMMTLSGCWHEHTNVIEYMSNDKMLVKDINTNKYKTVFLGRNAGYIMKDPLKYACVGDTIIINEYPVICGYDKNDSIKVYDGPTRYHITFNDKLLQERKHQEHLNQKDSIKFMQYAVMHKNLGKQR